MGCGASKSDVIKSASSADAPLPKKGPKDSTNSSAKSDASTIPANEAYQNGGGGNNNGGNRLPKSLPPLKPLRNIRTEKPPEPIAFEVSATEGEEAGSLIKKHPPRRLRQLEENAPELPNITHQEIEEKVALANQRRNQVLTQRVASARQKSARGARTRKPVTDSEQYTMAEYENELFGPASHVDGGIGGGIGGDFS